MKSDLVAVGAPTVSDTGSVRVVVIDDHDVVHAGVQLWCANAEPSIEFVGNYVEPQEFADQQLSVTHDVDVVLFDLQVDGKRPAFDALVFDGSMAVKPGIASRAC